MLEYFCIGQITSAHGVKGAVRVFPYAENPTVFERLKEVYYSLPGSDKPAGKYTIERAQYQKGMVLLTFAEVTDRNTAELLKGRGLLISREDADPLEEGEYYISDLLGLQAVSDEGEDLGKVSDWIETGANDVLIVKHHGSRELLVPFIKDCIRNVDLSGGTITVHLIPGLREDE